MLAAVIRTVLKDEALAPSTNDKLILREKSRERKIVMELEVTDMPPDVTAIHVEKLVGEMGSLSGIEDGRWKQKCDYLLVCEDQGRDVAIFIELKKTLGLKQKEKGREQLRRSLPLLKYLCSICRIDQEMKPDESEVDERYFLIGEKDRLKLDKQPVKSGRALHEERYKSITVNILFGTHVRFGRLRSA